MSTLRLRYEPEKDFDGRVRPDGELHAHVEVQGFSARSFAWFTRHQVEEFAQRLAAYPPTKPVEMTGGYFHSDSSPRSVLLGLSVSDAGRGAGVLIRVKLASDDIENDAKLQQMASLCIHADSASLDRFRVDIIRMLNDEGFEAVLTGE